MRALGLVSALALAVPLAAWAAPVLACGPPVTITCRGLDRCSPPQGGGEEDASWKPKPESCCLCRVIVSKDRGTRVKVAQGALGYRDLAGVPRLIVGGDCEVGP